MKSRQKSTDLQTLNIRRVLIGTGIILLIPLIAMLVSDEMNWGAEDFVIMGVLVAGMGLLAEVVTKRLSRKYHVPGLILLAVMFVLIWAQLAVGIFE